MSNTPIQLGNLNFDGIKQNLVNFLQNSDNNLDIDFEGSIANTLVDLLSYNTLYYAFYSNMLMNESFMDSAQRVESLVSLSKPLGYTISHKNSASVVLSLTNNGSNQYILNQYLTSITGVVDGVNYTFTYTNPLSDNTNTPDSIIAPGETKSFKFYQSSSQTLNAPVVVDYKNQKFDLNNKNIDPRTIRVSVGESDGVKEYTRISNNNSSLSSSSRVYYLETTSSGYSVYFGAPTDTSGVLSGRGVGETEIVYVSYLTSNGSGGNGSTNFTGLLSTIDIGNSSTNASGGYDNPDINLIKFAAPRNFVASGSLVTVSDYEVAILETGLLSVGTNPENNISVYGSSTAADRSSGRVLFSLFDAALNGGAGQVITETNTVPQNITVNFKEEVLAGISFEYREPLEVDITFNSNEDNDAFNSAYRRGFNQTFSDSLNSSSILVETTKIPAKQKNTTANLTGVLSGGASEVSGKFDFKNEIDFTSTGTTFSISFKPLGSNVDSIATISNNLINYASGTTLSSDNPSSGRFELDPAKFQSVGGITLNLTTGQIVIKDELLVNPKITGSG